MCAVGASQDHTRVKGNNDRRSTRPTCLWTHDFHQFEETINPLIAAENDKYVVICPGETKRDGAGLAVIAGLAIDTQILDRFRKVDSVASWEVNRIAQAYDRSAGHQQRGVVGRSQQSAFSIYMGQFAKQHGC